MTHRLSCPRKRASSNLGALVEAQCPTQGLASTGSSACADDDGRVGGAAGAHAMRRREFIAALGAAASSVSWPLAVRAQERVRRIGVLTPWHANDTEAQSRVTAFTAGPAAIGLDRRPKRSHRLSLGQRQTPTRAKICSRTGRARAGRHPGPFQRSPPRHCWRRPAPSRSCSPVVTDPVAAGYVESLARPGGNATGFIPFEYCIGWKMAGAAQGDRAARDASGGSP